MKCKEGFLSSGHHCTYFLLLAYTVTARRGAARPSTRAAENTTLATITMLAIYILPLA